MFHKLKPPIVAHDLQITFTLIWSMAIIKFFKMLITFFAHNLALPTPNLKYLQENSLMQQIWITQVANVSDLGA